MIFGTSMNDIISSIQDELLVQNHSQLSLFIGIILLSYVLEDLAIVTAASLSAQGVLPTSVGLIAAFIGIASGDLGLYFLGKASTRIRPFRYKTLTNPHLRYIRKKLKDNPMLNLFIIRFIPGLRTIGFTLSGIFHISLKRFFVAVMAATGIWTAIVFPSVYFLGTTTWAKTSENQWLLIPVMTFILFSVNRFAKKRLQRN